jgi:molecular chaperone HtpG
MTDTELIPFEFDTQRVIELFAKQIYQSPLALLRENTQNAFDAVRQRIHREGSKFNPEINITIAPSEVTVADNGLGMTASDLRQHFWKAGSSSKNNDEARAAGVVGTFGIGAMASFGIADALTVETQSAISGERCYSHAEKAKLSFKEDCVELRVLESGTSPGTVVRAHVSPNFHINVAQAKEYIKSFVFLVDIPIYLNGELVSQQSVEVAVPMVPATWKAERINCKIGPRLSADVSFVMSNNADVWLQLTKLLWDESPIAGRMVLRSGTSTLRAFRSGFGLANASVSSAYQFGGIVDLLVLEPTAGREAITVDGVQFLQSMMIEVDAFVSELLSKRDECDASTAFMTWASRHKRVDLLGRLRATIVPGDRERLSDLAAMSAAKPILFYEGADQGVVKLHASEESPVLVLARSNPRRHCEELFIASKVKTLKISDSPTVRKRKSLLELELDESALAFRVESILDIDYFVRSEVSFGEISHGQPVFAQKQGELILLTFNPEGQSVKLLLDLFEQDFAVFGGMVKDFVRNVVFPRIAEYVPSSTRQGAEAFLKAIRKSRELFEYGDSDLGDLPQIWEDQRDGRITVDRAVELSKMAVRTNVQYVEQSATVHANQVVGDVIRNEQALQQASSEQADYAFSESETEPAPAITRIEKESPAKLLLIGDSEPALRRYRCFLAISDRARDEMGEFFLQPHRTTVVWGGQKTLFIFLHHSGHFGLYYDLQTREPIEASAGGGSFPTATIVLKNRIFIPIPNAIQRSFVPNVGELKRFEVRADIIRTEVSDEEMRSRSRRSR